MRDDNYSYCNEILKNYKHLNEIYLKPNCDDHVLNSIPNLEESEENIKKFTNNNSKSILDNNNNNNSKSILDNNNNNNTCISFILFIICLIVFLTLFKKF